MPIFFFSVSMQNHSRTPKTYFTLFLKCIAYRLSKFGQIMAIKFFFNIFLCKICFSHFRCIFQQKNGGHFFSPKKNQTGGVGGGPRGVWQKTTLFPDFFSRYTPLSLVASTLGNFFISVFLSSCHLEFKIKTKLSSTLLSS